MRQLEERSGEIHPRYTRLEIPQKPAKPSLHSNCKSDNFDPEVRITSVRASQHAVRPLHDWIRGNSRFLVLWGSTKVDWRRATAATLAFGFTQRGHSVILLEADRVGVSIAETLARDFVLRLARCLMEQGVWQEVAIPTNTNELLSFLHEMLQETRSITWPYVIIYSQGSELVIEDAHAKEFSDLLHGAKHLRVLYLADLHLGVFEDIVSSSEHYRIPPGDAARSVEIDPIERPSPVQR